MLSKQFVCERYTKAIFSILLLLSATLTFSMEFSPSADEGEQQHNLLEKGAIVRVVKGPERLRNQIMEIQGTSETVWGIKDVWGSHEALMNFALSNYLVQDKGPFDKDTLPVSCLNVGPSYDEVAITTRGDINKEHKILMRKEKESLQEECVDSGNSCNIH